MATDMTNYHKLIQPDTGQKATPIHIVDRSSYEEWLKKQPDSFRTALHAQKFDGGVGGLAILPADNDAPWSVVFGISDVGNPGIWALAKASANLPGGTYRLANGAAGEAFLGWMLGQYSFDDYLSDATANEPRILVTKEPGRIQDAVFQAEATALVRDMVNRPPADMGPAAIEAQAKRIASANKAVLTVTSGDALEKGYPLIHAVGRAAARDHAPRLIEILWGDERHPRIAIIGKGVTFDSGGLDIKSASGMRIMKKDMGGGAHALSLAELIMKSHLPVRLHMLIAAVENSIAGNAFRPGDIIKSRKGITVEIDNTDAEGRLVLADAITRAVECDPVLMIDFATLTGAARVALGPELPALFVNDDDLATGILAAAQSTSDPMWRMPLWDGYEDMLASDIADTSNSGGSFAGAVTAALFLKKFVPGNVVWAHLDTYAWRPTAKPGRPKGGEALGLRAIFRYLAEKYPVR